MTDDGHARRTSHKRKVLNALVYLLLVAPFVVIGGSLLYIGKANLGGNQFMIASIATMVLVVLFVALARFVDERYLGGTL